MFRTIATATLLALIGAPSLAQPHPGRGHGAVFENADANKDGSVTREEFVAARAEHFSRFDRNADGWIDSNDVPQRALEKRQGNGGMLQGQFDTDGDGKVSKDEFVNGPTLAFDRADTDKNNVIDAQELAAIKEAAKARAEERRQR